MRYDYAVVGDQEVHVRSDTDIAVFTRHCSFNIVDLEVAVDRDIFDTELMLHNPKIVFDESVLNQVCDLMNITPTTKEQKYFVTDTMDFKINQNKELKMKIYMKTECITWYGHYSNDHKIEITEGFYLNLQDAKGSGKWRETKKVDKITKKGYFRIKRAI